MTYCAECKSFFEDHEADKVWESYGPWNEGEYEYYCPNCHGTELHMADECEICHEPIPPAGYRDDHLDVCDSCKEFVLEDLAKVLVKTFRGNELETVFALFENCSLEIWEQIKREKGSVEK